MHGLLSIVINYRRIYMLKLYKRGNIYWASVTKDGKRTRFSTKTSDKSKAESVALASAAKKGHISDGSHLRWNHLVSRYLSDIQYKSSKEQAGDRAKLDWITSHLGNPLLETITKRQFVTIIDIKRDKSGFATANRYISVINSLMARAFNEWEWLSKPIKLKAYHEAIKTFKWLSIEERDKLVSFCPKWLGQIVIFATETGLRKSNILQLKWDHISTVNSVLWVDSDKAKAGVAIRVPLSTIAKEVLYTQYGYEHTRMGYVFDRESVSKRLWDKICKDAGLEGLRFHDLRHTFASWQVAAGKPIYEVMKLMGHQDIKSTMRYAHLEPSI